MQKLSCTKIIFNLPSRQSVTAIFIILISLLSFFHHATLSRVCICVTNNLLHQVLKYLEKCLLQSGFSEDAIGRVFFTIHDIVIVAVKAGNAPGQMTAVLSFGACFVL